MKVTYTLNDDQYFAGFLRFFELHDEMGGKETESLVGTLREFSLDKDWGIAKSRMENFFVANGIKEDARKRALMLNSLDDPTYKLIANLAVP